MKLILSNPLSRIPALAVICVAVLVTGCDTGEEPPTRAPVDNGRSDYATREKPEPAITVAVAEISPTSNGNAEGTVRFRQPAEDAMMRVEVDLQGLEPGLHGFHIHEFGDCSAPDASSAGGHYNPRDTRHGSPDDEEHHVGDMGNIEADEDGKVSTELEFFHLTFTGPTSILDKAVVIHSQEDDFETQPTGNAGARVGCGVIRVPVEQETL
ncbi:superoxide dismutase family protein [Kineobactrum sediminis]|uniref:Superoxide dismutase [Cu-Zn] n=1 Tax=Kineobactrum sediminis TaxID=1905677 RepID=A0A2N5Y6I3_9GAMM|nr:superoxide dismutase family protein [Kineobactrum sediminis]PLW84005.1 superoxide dismutase family protein [Kineobactrum sediminis]